jgi:hypothetical protein
MEVGDKVVIGAGSREWVEMDLEDLKRGSLGEGVVKGLDWG